MVVRPAGDDDITMGKDETVGGTATSEGGDGLPPLPVLPPCPARTRLESTCSSGGDLDIEPLDLDDLQSYDRAKNDQ